MKNLSLLFMFFLLVSCGEDIVYRTVEKEVEVPGPEVEVPVEVEVEKEVIKEVFIEVPQEFEAVWSCENNGLIELYVDSQDRVYIEAEGQQLVSVNPKGLNGNNFADYPAVDAERLPLSNGKVKYQKDVNYNSGSNLRKDKDNALINGTFRTDYTFSILEDDTLKVQVQTFDKKIGQSGAKRTTNRTIICN